MEKKEEDIIAGDKLIAEFMGCYGAMLWAGGEEVYRYGFKDTHITDRWHESEFNTKTPYHFSWDWLCPVMDKICGLGYTVQWTITDGSTCRIWKHRKNIPNFFVSTDRPWTSIVEFIIWYNTQSSQTTKP